MRTVINVSFRSEHIEVATTLFSDALNVSVEGAHRSSLETRLELDGDMFSIRDVRSWLSSALSCGLIYAGSCNES